MKQAIIVLAIVIAPFLPSNSHSIVASLMDGAYARKELGDLVVKADYSMNR